MSKKFKWPAIPPRIKVTGKHTYEIVHIDEFKDLQQLGECRFDPTQIVIKNGQSDKEAFSTALHECLHAASNEYDINLTETQVLKLEKALVRILKLNGWI